MKVSDGYGRRSSRHWAVYQLGFWQVVRHHGSLPGIVVGVDSQLATHWYIMEKVS